MMTATNNDHTKTLDYGLSRKALAQADVARRVMGRRGWTVGDVQRATKLARMTTSKLIRFIQRPGTGVNGHATAPVTAPATHVPVREVPAPAAVKIPITLVSAEFDPPGINLTAGIASAVKVLKEYKAMTPTARAIFDGLRVTGL